MDGEPLTIELCTTDAQLVWADEEIYDCEDVDRVYETLRDAVQAHFEERDK